MYSYIWDSLYYEPREGLWLVEIEKVETTTTFTIFRKSINFNRKIRRVSFFIQRKHFWQTKSFLIENEPFSMDRQFSDKSHGNENFFPHRLRSQRMKLKTLRKGLFKTVTNVRN